MSLVAFDYRIDDTSLSVERSRDTASDDGGWIIPLDDNDPHQLVELRKTNPVPASLKTGLAS